MVKFNNCRHLGKATGDRFPPARGLGDWLADALSTIGITKARWSRLTQEYLDDHANHSNDCGSCGRRQRFVNWLGRWLGMSPGRDPELHEALKLLEFPDQPIYHCALHDLCIGRGELRTDLRELTGTITFCQHCKQFEENYG